MNSFRLAPAVLTALALLFCGNVMAAEIVDSHAEPAFVAAAPVTPPDSVTGWVVDANDWLDRGFIGAKREQSALTAADLGMPLVIVTGSGEVIYPISLTPPTGPMMDNVRLISLAEQRITATGRLIRRGRERGFVIENISRAPETAPTPSFPVRESADVQIAARVADLGLWLGKGDSFRSDVKHTRQDVENGEPLVLIGDSGSIYYPVVRKTATASRDIPSLLKYCDQRVVVTGRVIVRGKELGIVVRSVAARKQNAPAETRKPEG